MQDGDYEVLARYRYVKRQSTFWLEPKDNTDRVAAFTSHIEWRLDKPLKKSIEIDPDQEWPRQLARHYEGAWKYAYRETFWPETPTMQEWLAEWRDRPVTFLGAVLATHHAVVKWVEDRIGEGVKAQNNLSFTLADIALWTRKYSKEASERLDRLAKEGFSGL